MQGLPQLIDRCAADFIHSFHHDWDQPGAEHEHEYGEAILNNLGDFETGLREELRRRIATRLRQRNTCVPISKLPQELLQLIFRFNLITSSGDRVRGYIRTMFILRSVSWGWRALLDRSPFLWGHITSSDRSEFISKAFENSKEAPLHLKYSRSGENGSQLLDKMLHHLHRVESIAIYDPTHDVFAKYFTSRAPLLKKMALRKRSEAELHRLIRPFSGSWTSLEELRIRLWGDIDWKEVQFGQLRVVDISYCGNLEISVIFRLIQENQHLEILALRNITFSSSGSLMQSNIPIVLLHLKDLTLSRLAFADSSNVHNRPQHPTLVILRHIRFPSCTKFTLRTSIERESTVDPEDLRGLLPSPLDILAHPSPNDLQTSQKPRGYLTAAFSEHGLTLTMAQEPEDTFTYEVKLDRTPRSISRRWLKSALEDRPGVTLQGFKLHVDIYEDSQMDDLVAFQASEAVTLLSVEIGDGGLGEGVVRRLLQILVTPYTSASGITVMAFPRLLGMEVDGWEFRGEAVLEMIKSRFGTPGAEAHRPEFITVNSGDRHREFLWDSLDEICELGGSTAIHFGAIDSWPSSSPRPGSPESVWPPFDDEGSSDTGEDDWNLDPEAGLHGVWEEEEGSLSSAETDDS